jgi:hypothetical protein
MPKQSQIEKAIEALQHEIDVLTMAINRLKAADQRVKPKAQPRRKVEEMKVGA